MSKVPFLKLIHQAGNETGICFKEINPNIVYQAIKEDKSFYMYGIDLGLNNSTSVHLAKNKDLTYSLLNNSNIDAIPHHFLLNQNSIYQESDSYDIAYKYFLSNNNNIVIKPSNGLQGQHCYHITDIHDLNEKLDVIFLTNNNVCMSPFYNSELEYRVVVLNHEPQLAFAKRRINNAWKHNLTGGGACVEDVESSSQVQLFELAKEISKIIDLKFCSIDFFLINNKFKVLEINNSVYLGSYSQSNPERMEKSIDVFKKALALKFNNI